MPRWGHAEAIIAAKVSEIHATPGRDIEKRCVPRGHLLEALHVFLNQNNEAMLMFSRCLCFPVVLNRRAIYSSTYYQVFIISIFEVCNYLLAVFVYFVHQTWTMTRSCSVCQTQRTGLMRSSWIHVLLERSTADGGINSATFDR